MAEIPTLFIQCPTILCHHKVVMYYPFIESFAHTLVDRLLIADEIQLVGGEIGPMHEVAISRTHYVSVQMEILVCLRWLLVYFLLCLR